MIKILIIFGIGLIEQVLYTAYLLSVDKRQVRASSVLMFIYMIFYLGIIAYSIKDDQTIPLLLAYAAASGIGNYVMMKWESGRKKVKAMEHYIMGKLLDEELKNDNVGDLN